MWISQRDHPWPNAQKTDVTSSPDGSSDAAENRPDQSADDSKTEYNHTEVPDGHTKNLPQQGGFASLDLKTTQRPDIANPCDNRSKIGSSFSGFGVN
ncbi:MAG: hypothetical protein L7U72_06170 [Rubripirellula sp.]|nr:hypothetical protein [Rubripirellula sp.]